jgi:diacylglycerol kinase (ATP)
MSHRSWLTMFRDAFRGIGLAVTSERSFKVHLPMALAVIALGFFFKVSTHEWLVLVLCIALVMTTELVNTGIERLAKAVTKEHNEHVRAALDISAGAVLTAAIGAVVCGLIIFVPHLLAWIVPRTP